MEDRDFACAEQTLGDDDAPKGIFAVWNKITVQRVKIRMGVDLRAAASITDDVRVALVDAELSIYAVNNS